MNTIAQQLNEVLLAENKHVYDMLSRLGRQIYYVKEGILSQSGEAKAKAHKYNATLGTAVENGQPMHLKVIQDTLSHYAPKDIYEYAPTAGKPELRRLWREKMFRENPSLGGKKVGTPIVTTGLTHGLSIVADLFAGTDDPVIVPDQIWENYEITFGVRRESRMVEYAAFNEQHQYNVEGLRQAILQQKDAGKAIVVLNFPNNPTGYTSGIEEGEQIIGALLEGAEAGIHIVVLVDDAYFGLFYGSSLRESLFARLVGVHSRILPIRIDGATKEEYVTGLRVGFLTFGADNEQVLEALEQKALGMIRSTISSSPHPSQSFVLHALQSPDYEVQKSEKTQIIKERAHKAMAVLESGKYP